MATGPMRELRGLYGMVDLRPDETPDDAVRIARALIDGGARIVQLRWKAVLGGTLLGAAMPLRTLTREAGVTFIVNDRADVALACGADGVHLGQKDLDIQNVRRFAPGLAIGLSTHDLAQARAAIEAGADYLGFGPVFATATKERPDPTTGVTGLADVCRTSPVPVVAIGGITTENAPRVRDAGASACAPIAAVTRAADITAAARIISILWS